MQIYYEPFVGGANLIDKINCRKRIGNDIHETLIPLLSKIQDGWEPPETITEEEYNEVRNNRQQYPNYYVGLVGFCATFGSKYFGGYARGFKADKITPRDLPNEAIRNLLAQAPNIKDVVFLNRKYLDIDMSKLKNAVIYCDPPYENTTKYETGSFNYKVFWDWVRAQSKNNFVFVSGYNAPEDFTCIWEKETTTALKVKEHEKRIEKLFVLSK